MNLDEIRQILELVREHGLAEFELEESGRRIRVRKEGNSSHLEVPLPVPATSAPPNPDHPPAATADAPAEEAAVESGDSPDLVLVKSPIVGTFYRAPEPGARPFVDVGDRVRRGQVLCVIEAMKLMNEIESEYEGEVVKVYVENGQPVQYGERLFAVKVA